MGSLKVCFEVCLDGLTDRRSLPSRFPFLLKLEMKRFRWVWREL